MNKWKKGWVCEDTLSVKLVTPHFPHRAVNVVESIGASMFTAPGQGSANPSPGGNTTQGNETEPEQNEIKTETMTIRVVPTPKDTENEVGSFL